MNRERLKVCLLFLLALSANLWLCLPGALAERVQDRSQARAEQRFMPWQSPAKLHRIVGSEKGDVRISDDGVEFQPRKGPALKLRFLDIQTFTLSPHCLVIKTYQDRKKHLPGMQRYRFKLYQPVPPEVASDLAREVRRPSQNEVPDPTTECIVITAAHHRTLTGGTNGALRFRDNGIDYVTSIAGDSRSWRWADIETVSEADPYHLLVFGYRDSYTFDLKKPLSRSLFNHVSDEIWTHSESEMRDGSVAPQSRHANEQQTEDK